MSTSLTAAAPNWEDPKLIETIKETVCKGATPAQFRMFLEVCRGTGLNPFLKEIYFVPSVGVMAARDGYLRVANQHPQFDGMETRVERDEKNIPIKAVCTVYRKDRSHPIICEAYYNEYRKPGNVWATYPSAMIAKVAEVLALKRSFAINGVVTEEEIGEREPQGSKEQQREYLASKGIGAPMSVAIDVEMPPATKPETIRELADTLDQPPQSEGSPFPHGNSVPERQMKTIEMRHASKVAEADAVLKDTVKPTEKLTAEMITIRKHFGEVKKLLSDLLGSDEIYYATLGAYNYKKSSHIKDIAEARKIYKDLVLIHKRATEDKKLRTELELAHLEYGQRFYDVLGANGCEKIDDVLGLDGDTLRTVLDEIKALGRS